MNKLVLLVLLIASSVPLVAQQNGTKMGFDVAYPVATANGYSYKLYVDTNPTGTVIPGVTCATVSVNASTCTFFLPSTIPTGAHDLLVSLVTPQGVESNKTTPFRIDVPTVPTNLRLQ